MPNLPFIEKVKHLKILTNGRNYPNSPTLINRDT